MPKRLIQKARRRGTLTVPAGISLRRVSCFPGAGLTLLVRAGNGYTADDIAASWPRGSSSAFAIKGHRRPPVASALGATVLDVINWLGDSLVKRFSFLPGWNPYRGAPYYMATRHNVGGQDVEYATWADLNNSFLAQPGPTSFPVNDDPDSYNWHARGCLALIPHIPNALDRFHWIDPLLAGRNLLPTDPRWAFAPMPHLAGDANSDGYVNVGDLQALVAVWGRNAAGGTWNPNADFNCDFYLNVGDLHLLVAHWGESLP